MRILLLSDPHCGSLTGLTPPKYGNTLPYAEDFWNWYKNEVTKNEYDYAIIGGDVIEGKGKKENMFHLTTNIGTQMDMAIDVLSEIKTKEFIFVDGTPYHTVDNFEAEHYIADKFSASILPEQYHSFNGITIEVSHAKGIGSKTSTPIGGDLAVRRAAIFSSLHSLWDERRPADYIYRGHLHEHRAVSSDYFKAEILRAMQIGDPRFNPYARRLDGYYSVGFKDLEITKTGHVTENDYKYKYKIGWRAYVDHND